MKKKIDLKQSEATPKSKKSPLKGIVKWAWLAVVVMLVFEALIANGQATNGRQLTDLQQKQSELSSEVDQLERQVAAAGSLQNIRERATSQLGLLPIDKNIIYLPIPTPAQVSHD